MVKPSIYDRSVACRGKGTPIEPSDFTPPFDELLQYILDHANTLFRCLRSEAKETWRNRPFHITFTDGWGDDERLLPPVQRH